MQDLDSYLQHTRNPVQIPRQLHQEQRFQLQNQLEGFMLAAHKLVTSAHPTSASGHNEQNIPPDVFALINAISIAAAVLH